MRCVWQKIINNIYFDDRLDLCGGSVFLASVAPKVFATLSSSSMSVLVFSSSPDSSGSAAGDALGGDDAAAALERDARAPRVFGGTMGCGLGWGGRRVEEVSDAEEEDIDEDAAAGGSLRLREVATGGIGTEDDEEDEEAAAGGI